MKRRIASILGTLALATVGLGAAASPASASITYCSASGGIDTTYYSVACQGNGASHPNEYRAWITCKDVAGTYYGLWESVDPSDPIPSTIWCPNNKKVKTKGYNTR